jgi:uncharacterized protein (TIGR03643 family)
LIASFFDKNNKLAEAAIDRIIEMAWEDKTPFEAIYYQFNLTESDVIKLMRSQLKRSSFNLWRKRVNSKISSKHLKLRSAKIKRFKCTRQKAISQNKITKRN